MLGAVLMFLGICESSVIQYCGGYSKGIFNLRIMASWCKLVTYRYSSCETFILLWDLVLHSLQ